jgi:NifU-like protein involved in Fe-S cluster formation
MDRFITQYYRELLRNGFKHCGSIENPSIFLDTHGEKIRICGSHISNYLNIYIQIQCHRIYDMKYLCVCDPTANVVVELLCDIAKGKTLMEVRLVTEDVFSQALGSHDEEFLNKAKGIIEFLGRGIMRFQAHHQKQDVDQSAAIEN